MGMLSEKFVRIYEDHRSRVTALEKETVSKIVELLDTIEAGVGPAVSGTGMHAAASAAIQAITPSSHSDGKIEVIKADITKLSVDAIVNPASRTLQGGGGIEGAIFAAGGPDFVEECHALGGCERGEAKITRGHQLPARFVIHTAGPVWRGGDHDESDTLNSCYLKSLELAVANGVKTIAFPAISTGNFGYPVTEAAKVAVSATSKFLAGNAAIEKVFMVVFSDDAAQAFNDAISSAGG